MVTHAMQAYTDCIFLQILLDGGVTFYHHNTMTHTILSAKLHLNNDSR